MVISFKLTNSYALFKQLTTFVLHHLNTFFNIIFEFKKYYDAHIFLKSFYNFFVGTKVVLFLKCRNQICI